MLRKWQELLLGIAVAALLLTAIPVSAQEPVELPKPQMEKPITLPDGLPKLPNGVRELPALPALPEKETGKVDLSSSGNLWFSWDFGFFVLTVLHRHYGPCGPYGWQWHWNVIVKRYSWQNDDEAWVNYHIGTRQSHCAFVWESRSGWSQEVCWNPPDFDNLWSQVTDMIYWYTPWGWSTTRYVSYFLTYLLIFVIGLAIAV